MHFWEWLIEEDSLSIFMCNNREHNHFILKVYSCLYNVCLYKMGANPETKAKLTAAKTRAWVDFTKHFPNADKNQFVAQTNVDQQWNITAEVFFKEGPGSLQSVFSSDSKYWSQQMKTALRLDGVGGFLYQLSPQKTKPALPIPAVDFTEEAPSIAKIFNQEKRIYGSPDELFVTKFRGIFQQTRLAHTALAELKTWLGGPNMKYWPQQLNFAVFCVTQGCGISRKIFGSGLTLTPQIMSFYQFHVYFTVRRVLYQLGGIQSISTLPGDPTFNLLNNHYDTALYKRICAEFGIDPSSDFCFTFRKKHRLGRVNGEEQLDFKYPGWMKFGDEGGKAIKGDLISYIHPDPVASTQYDWFAPKTSAGLTQARLAQVNQLDQLAVDESKVRLNLAVCPGAWLMPARMIINTESTVGYHNKLKQAAPGMKLGINNDVNPGTKKSALKLMEGGPSKINPSNSHPSNPIHKAATAAQDPKPPKHVRFNLPSDEVGEIEEEIKDKTPQHEINKTTVIIGEVRVATLLIIALR